MWESGFNGHQSCSCPAGNNHKILEYFGQLSGLISSWEFKKFAMKLLKLEIVWDFGILEFWSRRHDDKFIW